MEQILSQGTPTREQYIVIELRVLVLYCNSINSINNIFYLSEMFGRNTSTIRNQWRLLALGKRKHDFN